jgi:DNA-binding SARP family transcriptional activator
MGSCIEIRILGRLRVRRPDGSIVDNTEWRTGKTADLVRLLALAGGRPVRVDALLDSLWPSVEETKARASLRTAASQIRRTLGVDCIERGFDGLALNNAWIDAEAFTGLAHEGRAHARGGHHAQVVRIAREAEALYVGDLDCHVAGEETWVSEARENLATLRRDLLTEAAESALALGWFRDAEDLATRALRADGMAERPHRLLMSAYAGLGETDRALRVFDRCRRLLAKELGVDPSPMTQAVHLQLLSGAPTPRAFTAVSPPESAVAAMEKVVAAAVRRDGAHFVGVRGRDGAGRCEVIVAMSQRLSEQGWQVIRLEPSDATLPVLSTRDDGRPVLVTLPCVDELSWHRVEQVTETMASLRHRRAVAIAPVSFDVLSRMHALVRTGVAITEHEVAPLDPEELETLASSMLGSDVAEDLVQELVALSDGLFARAAAGLQQWLAEGRILSSTRGLIVTGADGASPYGTGTGSWAPLHHLPAAAAELAAMLAALQAPASTTRLAAVMADLGRTVDLCDVQENLDRLVDAQVLQVGEHGYEFRHPLVRDAAESWLRPADRRQLHRCLAGSSRLGAEERAVQWTLAGEPVEALRALLDAAEVALDNGYDARGTALVTHAFRLAGGGSWAPDEQLEAFESVGQAAAQLGCTSLARRAFERGAEVAVTVDPEAARRLAKAMEAMEASLLVPVQWAPTDRVTA